MALSIWVRYGADMKTARVSVTDGKALSNVTFYEDDESDAGHTIIAELPDLFGRLLDDGGRTGTRRVS
ncbi:MAG TPA: hypothetical protein PLF11_01390 [Bacillota bacterium]|nr:hypothetical protein [Bacillota bacterium]